MLGRSPTSDRAVAPNIRRPRTTTPAQSRWGSIPWKSPSVTTSRRELAAMN